jgi:hypothetical protein
VPYILGWVFEEEEERPWFHRVIFFAFLLLISAQSGLSKGREGYETPASSGGRVDKKIEAKSSVPYMGTWDGQSQWCNRLSEGGRYYDRILG